MRCITKEKSKEAGIRINMVTYYLLAVVTAAVFAIGYVLANKYLKCSEGKRSWVLKGASLLFAILFAIRYLCNEIALTNTRGLNIHSPFGYEGQAVTVFATFSVWFTFAAAVLLFTYPFYLDKIKILTPLVKFFATLVYLVDFITIGIQLQAMGGADALKNGVTLQGVFFSLEVGLALVICGAVWWEKYRTAFSWRGIGKGVLAVALMIAVSIPVFALQVLLDYGPRNILLKDLVP